MLVFDNLRVETFSLDYIHVQWRIQDTDEDLAQYRFTVLRSGSPEGPFDVIKANLMNEFDMFDYTANQFSKWRKLYYKVRVTNVLTEETAETSAESIEEPRGADLLLLEIRRRNEEILLPRFVGTRVAFLIAKTFGQRCPECFDERKRRQRTSRCLACYNTGYNGGYFTQINGWINMTPPDDVARVEEIGETHPSATTAWTGHYPILGPRDMIVEMTNKRWRVVDVNYTEKRRVTGHQVMRLAEIERGDIEYSFNISSIEIPADPSSFKGFYPQSDFAPEGDGLL